MYDILFCAVLKYYHLVCLFVCVSVVYHSVCIYILSYYVMALVTIRAFENILQINKHVCSFIVNLTLGNKRPVHQVVVLIHLNE